MTELRAPDASRHRAWAEAVREFGSEVPHGSGLWNLPERERTDLGPRACRTTVTLLAHLADPATTYLDETVPSWYFWISDGDEVVGFLAFRHRLSAWLLEEGGHIGYSVRASHRRRGHASSALRMAVARAPELGLDRVLVTCDTDNLASAATIESCGGVQEDVRRGKRRFWIEV